MIFFFIAVLKNSDFTNDKVLRYKGGTNTDTFGFLLKSKMRTGKSTH